MIPTPWEFALLALAVYRLTRLAGWDDFPPIAAARAWLIGEEWVPTIRLEEVAPAIVDAADHIPISTEPFVLDLGVVDLPGKQPSSEAEGVRPTYRRPLLAHLVHCPFCVGWWISLAAYLAWLAVPSAALVCAVPLALSGVVGLVAKNLDP